MGAEPGEIVQNELASLRQQVRDLNAQVFEKNKRIHELEDMVTRLLHPPPLEHKPPQEHIPTIAPAEKAPEPPAKPRTLPAKRVAKVHKK